MSRMPESLEYRSSGERLGRVVRQCFALASLYGALQAGCGGSDSEGINPAGVGGKVVVTDASLGGSSNGGAGNGGSAGTTETGGVAGEGGAAEDASLQDTDASVGEAGPDASSEGAAQDEGSSDDVVSDVHQEGTPWPGDDPCPTAPFLANCSDSCGPTDECQACSVLKHHVAIGATDQLPLVLRTPSNPGSSLGCLSACDAGTSPAFAVGISFDIFESPNTHVRATVEAPWSVQLHENAAGWCPSANECWAEPVSKFAWHVISITTTDPAAPARNVMLEYYPASSTNGCL